MLFYDWVTNHVTAVILVLGCIVKPNCTPVITSRCRWKGFCTGYKWWYISPLLGHISAYIGAGAGAPAMPGVYIAAAVTGGVIHRLKKSGLEGCELHSVKLHCKGPA